MDSEKYEYKVKKSLHRPVTAPEFYIRLRFPDFETFGT